MRCDRSGRCSASLGEVSDTEPAPPAAPPSLSHTPRQQPHLVDKIAAGSAFAFVRQVDALVEHCDHAPAKLVRGGGLATRDVRARALLLGLPATTTSAQLDLARAAALLGVSTYGSDSVLTPTAEFDDWQNRSLEQQWGHLVEVWLRHQHTSGSLRFKLLCLSAFGDPADGVALTESDLRHWLAWQRPRRHHGADRQAATVYEQAAWLGVTGLGARSSYLSAHDGRLHPGLLAEHLPERVEHVLVQADLTAVAPGPLSPDAARDLGSLADVESRGGATVYRFSVRSLQRAKSLGWTGNEILQTLVRRSRTPLPQPLTYLVRELDRTADAPTTRLELPTSQVNPNGAAPAPHRLGNRAPVPAAADEPALDAINDAELDAIMRQLRSVDPPPSPVDPDALPPVGQSLDASFASPLAALREAAETGEVVWFGYVDTQGVASERLVGAVDVSQGRLVATDVRSSELVSVAFHRISRAHIIRSRDD